MSNGDLVSVDAKHEKVIKMRSTGERLAERHVHGATRGVSVCMDDRIYVLVEGGPNRRLVFIEINPQDWTADICCALKIYSILAATMLFICLTCKMETSLQFNWKTPFMGWELV
ncbi:hypothetical protein T12_987 [Trichinella patagoniensis]|uniref:Uncharacterized protein n=2 Tax=Trichinella patagoniensis TaxID=990121 RepID=A0A0V0Z646_9BILA|nr:hypothetical protein T12_987 [Trichinella patagoniensis]